MLDLLCIKIVIDYIYSRVFCFLVLNKTSSITYNASFLLSARDYKNLINVNLLGFLLGGPTTM